MAEKYGVRSLMGTARRSIFILDGEGIIRYQREEPLSLTYRSVDDLLEALDASQLLDPARRPRPNKPASART